MVLYLHVHVGIWVLPRADILAEDHAELMLESQCPLIGESAQPFGPECLRSTYEARLVTQISGEVGILFCKST